MKFIQYSKYFFYLASNWTVSIAAHIIKNEVRGERQYGITTTGADELATMEEKGIDISHATIYMPASYDLLENLFSQLTPGTYNNFLDIGCGKGRALCVAASAGFRKVTGIDFSREFCMASQNNLQIISKKVPGLEYNVINNDAFYYEIPADADCIFFFNPFDEVIMQAVLENIDKSVRKNPRNLTVIYCNPLQRELFHQYGFTRVFHTQTLKYLEADIYLREKK